MHGNEKQMYQNKKRKKVLTFGETSGKICLAFKKGTELQNGVVRDSLRTSKKLEKSC